MWRGGQDCPDGIPDMDHAPVQHNRHHACAPDHLTIRATRQHLGQEARTEGVNLRARVPQAGEFNDSLMAQMQHRATRQRQKVQPAQGDILAHLTRGDGQSLGRHLVQQFRADQMHLPQVRLARIARHARAVLDRHPTMRVTQHTLPRDQGQVRHRVFGEAVPPVPRQGDNDGCGAQRFVPLRA